MADALRGARAAGCIVLLLTNVPRPSSTLPAALGRIGLPPDAWDAIVTSGDAIRVELARRAPGPMHRLGRDTDTALWDGLGLAFSDLPQARFVAIAGLRTADETPPTTCPSCGLPGRGTWSCCAPTPTCRSRWARAWSGARARWRAGTRPSAVGSCRPASRTRPSTRGPGPSWIGSPGGQFADRILAIGDGIGTDILGANRWGFDSLFIASGMHGTSLLRRGELDPGRAAAALDDAGVTATYVMARLA